jgi:hypothetical protein
MWRIYQKEYFMLIRLKSAFAICALIVAATASPAVAQQQQLCSPTVIVGQATNSSRATAYIGANRAWAEQAISKFGSSNGYRAARARCAMNKASKDYTCTVSANACNTMTSNTRSVRNACIDHPCMSCCYNPDHQTYDDCRATCM